MTSDPTAGDPASIRAIAATLQRRAGEIRTAASRVQRQADAVSAGEWTGKSRAPFVHAAADVSTGGERVATQVDQVATVLTTYAARVEQIQDEARTIKSAQARNQHDAVTNSRSTQKLQDSHAVDVAAQLGGLAVEAASLTASKRALDQSWDDLIARRKAADAETASNLRNSDTIGAFSVSTSSISGMSDSQFLTFLAGLRPEEVAAFAGNSTIADRLAGLKDPDAVAKWWSGLGGEHGKGTKGEHSAAQDAFIAAFPTAVGNLNGVAYWARDIANRRSLASQIAATEARIAQLKQQRNTAGWSPALDEELTATLPLYLSQLTNLRKASNKSGDLPKRYHPQVVAFRPGPPPLGAVSVGDIDSASNVSFVVPGMATTLGDATVVQRMARNLVAEQRELGAFDTAAVAWVNYETPVNAERDFREVLSDDKARVGGEQLSNDLEGWRASVGEDAVLNVVGHSYGTTTAAIGLEKSPRPNVNAFVSLGSAGMPWSVPNAAATHAEHVFAGTGDEPVAGLGRLGSARFDPEYPLFGAKHLETGAEDDLAGVSAHDPLKYKEPGDPYGYFDRGTSSLHNTAAATLGQK
ncbi:alpha/beta hydrolase [Curtobacterium sp. SL109]|uniref:alpha/beta hydrolase n=1 Tax=Curtobacterium sp. SL109 TaxID=2994662 RepID=UPI0022764771|nr:alpha/beta hydrolase [Curtobacterium sp. SL109]MCY1694876.1 alpha/beta hydrolase [Curtobacterium sp. SL109]